MVSDRNAQELRGGGWRMSLVCWVDVARVLGSGGWMDGWMEGSGLWKEGQWMVDSVWVGKNGRQKWCLGKWMRDG